MSSERYGRTIRFYCDDCGEDYEDQGDTWSGAFKQVWDDAKSEGWRCSNESGEWMHYCPACANDVG